jgi:hypothetical protein
MVFLHTNLDNARVNVQFGQLFKEAGVRKQANTCLIHFNKLLTCYAFIPKSFFIPMQDRYIFLTQQEIGKDSMLLYNHSSRPAGQPPTRPSVGASSKLFLVSLKAV